MVRIEFLGPIAKASIDIEANSLRDVALYLQQDIQLSVWLDKLAIAVNDTMVCDLDHVLKDGDKISLLPPVCGG
ncbi:MAG: MoaD/ThiS family protein [Campylobacterales bacterium]|nr:MoaD/ThiS family protein [Campylobacterales bacterium]